MITINLENDFILEQEESVLNWIEFVINQENKELGEINYVFCDDEYLVKINVNKLKHNTLTDIISIDYTVQNLISGDIYISTERVTDNANNFNALLKDELHRVMIHGVLHYCGYDDKTSKEKQIMRSKEDYYLSLRSF
jgi:probable rRNA maturation factor